MGLTGQCALQLRDPAEAGAAAAVLCGGEEKIADKVQEIVFALGHGPLRDRGEVALCVMVPVQVLDERVAKATELVVEHVQVVLDRRLLDGSCHPTEVEA